MYDQSHDQGDEFAVKYATSLIKWCYMRHRHVGSHIFDNTLQFPFKLGKQIFYCNKHTLK
jgi:hypothetical protein